MQPREALRGAVIALAVASLGLLGGCASAGAQPSAEQADVTAVVELPQPVPQLPVTLTDADDRDVTIESTSRILPMTSGVAEVVFSLGLGDFVVGRDVGTTFAQAADLPVVTRAHDISAEGVLALRPTVVIGDASAGPPEALEQIRQAGVPVVLVREAWSLDDVAPRIEQVAQALGVDEAGTALIERTQADIAAARSQIEGNPTIAFLYLRGQASVYLLGGDGAGADSMIEALGATDAGTKAGLTSFTPLTAEAMVKAQPDVLLVMTKGLDSVGGIDGLLELPGIAQTPAGRERRIIAVDDGLLLSFGPRTGAVLRSLAEQLEA
jgi:iron complex transport system substrate-binding protein